MKTAIIEERPTADKYIELFLAPIRKCREYKPKFGESQNADGQSGKTKILTLDGRLELDEIQNTALKNRFEKILSESMHIIGYKRIQVRNIRRRNTKKGLYEFNVRAVWN